MTALSPYDRVKMVICDEVPDRIPVIPQITYTTAQLTGVGLVEALHSPEKTAEALLKGQRVLGYDAIYAGWESSFNLLAEAMGCTMRYPEDSVPQVAVHVVKSSQDLSQIEIPDPYHSGRLPLHIEMLRLIKTEVQDQIPVMAYTPGPFTLAGQLCGVNLLMAATIQNPKFVHDLTNITLQASTMYALANIEAGADIIVTADPTASGSLISSKTFDTFAAPHLSKIANTIIKAGATASLHICGKTTTLLESMANTGVKIIELDHLVNLVEAKRLVGKRVVIMGNLNPIDLLLNGTPEQVEAAAKECIKTVGQDGRYILSSGCEIPPDAPLDNVKAMVAAAQKFGSVS
ncbi:MAG: uroporphyrinogen decarboxylase family protein [Candidatus Thorarchaeota archaeon]